ncbi:MAG TPA: Gfo/Idh/MocA family oxidoreductase [Armatimonadota bacterium]|jgi:predicted dehydrogenase
MAAEPPESANRLIREDLVSSNPIHVAVIGYGGAFNMGLNHFNWMKKAGLVPTAACDLDADRVAQAAADFPGLKTFTDYKEMLKDPDVDLVVNILPHYLHGQVNLDIVSAGKHCVSEKPFTLSVAEADACIAAAEKHNVTLTVFHNRRFDGDHRAMMEVIANGEIGEPFHIEAGLGGYHHPGHWWRSNKDVSGGALWDWGVHFIDWVLDLIPDPVENVTAFYHKRVWDDVSNEDQTQAIIRFSSGKYADVRISSLDAAPRAKFRILGTKGAIVMENPWSQAFTVRKVENGVTWEREFNVADKHYPDSGEAFYADLAAHLRDGAPLTVTAQDGRRNIAVLEAAERSAVSHQAEPPA